VTLLVVAGVGF